MEYDDDEIICWISGKCFCTQFLRPESRLYFKGNIPKNADLIRCVFIAVPEF
jgi:hypothetical protein